MGVSKARANAHAQTKLLVVETERSDSKVKKMEAEKENSEEIDQLQPIPKRRKVSLSLPKDRFHFAIEDSDLKEAMKAYSTKNTAANNKWALTNYEQWFEQRKETLSAYECKQPMEVLLSNDPKEIGHILSLYVKETRKVDGNEYTPKTLYLLLAGLQRHMRLQKGRALAINIFNDPRLEAFHNVCDHEFRRLHQKGIGAEATHTETLSKDDENILWDTNVLDITTPAGLLNCVFFYNGKNLCLRGGDEHRQLKFTQLRRDLLYVDGVQKNCYIYTEHGSKNRSGGLGQLHIENKVVHHFEVPEAGSRDYVKILDLYLSKLPKEAIARDNFYVRPVSVIQEGKPWFTSIPIGRNKLATMVKTMCSKAGVEGNKTNHSLRSFGVTSMFEENIPEKVIQERSGHRSITALRVYEKTTNKQMVEASRVLSSIQAPETLPKSSNLTSALTESSVLMEKTSDHLFRGCSFTNCNFTVQK